MPREIIFILSPLFSFMLVKRVRSTYPVASAWFIDDTQRVAMNAHMVDVSNVNGTHLKQRRKSIH